LATLAGGSAFADPGVFDEAVQQGINEIVVHGRLAGDQAHVLFQE